MLESSNPDQKRIALSRNDFLEMNQMTLPEAMKPSRTDLVCFLKELPLELIELRIWRMCGSFFPVPDLHGADFGIAAVQRGLGRRSDGMNARVGADSKPKAKFPREIVVLAAYLQCMLGYHQLTTRSDIWKTTL